MHSVYYINFINSLKHCPVYHHINNIVNMVSVVITNLTTIQTCRSKLEISWTSASPYFSGTTTTLGLTQNYLYLTLRILAWLFFSK